MTGAGAGAAGAAPPQLEQAGAAQPQQQRRHLHLHLQHLHLQQDWQAGAQAAGAAQGAGAGAAQGAGAAHGAGAAQPQQQRWWHLHLHLHLQQHFSQQPQAAGAAQGAGAGAAQAGAQQAGAAEVQQHLWPNAFAVRVMPNTAIIATQNTNMRFIENPPTYRYRNVQGFVATPSNFLSRSPSLTALEGSRLNVAVPPETPPANGALLKPQRPCRVVLSSQLMTLS
jgi:hypothetical protein